VRRWLFRTTWWAHGGNALKLVARNVGRSDVRPTRISHGPPTADRRRRKILTLGEGFTTQAVTLWCFNTVGRKILTLGEGFTTQVVTLWCFNTVGRKILTLGEGFTTQVVTLWCSNTQHSGGDVDGVIKWTGRLGDRRSV
jgi:hypothetical protein